MHAALHGVKSAVIRYTLASAIELVSVLLLLVGI